MYNVSIYFWKNLIFKCQLIFSIFILYTGISYETCRRDNGWCVQPHGIDQDDGVVKLNSMKGDNETNRRACFKACLTYSGSTGCEMYTAGSVGGCYVHTQNVEKGSGDSNHYCWVFSNCESKMCFL